MPSFSTRLLRLSGLSMILAGILLFLLNIIFTPQILAIEDFAESAASTAWAWRLGLASLTALLLIFGSLGVYALFEKKRPGSLAGLIMLVVLLTGNALLLAHEYNQWLFVRDMALNFPETLNALEDLDGFTLFDLSAAMGAGGLFLAWIITAIMLWTYKVCDKRICILMIVGLMSSPIISIVASPDIALVVSTAILGFGWVLLGRAVLRIPASA